MQRDIVLLVIGALAAVPFGFLTNILFERLYKATARVQIGPLRGWRRSTYSLLGSLRKIRGLSPNAKVTICTDGSFIDTAVFFLAAVEASKVMKDVTIQLRHEDWLRIPFAVSREANNIFYFNRGLVDEFINPVEVWSNLCSYRGYALMGRPQKFAAGPPLDPRSLETLLATLSPDAPIRILSMGGDATRVLKTPLTPFFSSHRVEFEEHPADHALQRFLSGRGDLFIGGLPQRLACVRHGYRELMTSESNPLMFGIDSLFFSGPQVSQELLLQVSVSWSRVCLKLKADEDYCRRVFKKWSEYAIALGISQLCFTEEEFVMVVNREPGKYINFFATRDDAAIEMIKASEKCLEILKQFRPQKTKIEILLGFLHKAYTG